MRFSSLLLIATLAVTTRSAYAVPLDTHQVDMHKEKPEEHPKTGYNHIIDPEYHRKQHVRDDLSEKFVRRFEIEFPTAAEKEKPEHAKPEHAKPNHAKPPPDRREDQAEVLGRRFEIEYGHGPKKLEPDHSIPPPPHRREDHADELARRFEIEYGKGPKSVKPVHAKPPPHRREEQSEELARRFEIEYGTGPKSVKNGQPKPPPHRREEDHADEIARRFEIEYGTGPKSVKNGKPKAPPHRREDLENTAEWKKRGEFHGPDGRHSHDGDKKKLPPSVHGELFDHGKTMPESDHFRRRGHHPEWEEDPIIVHHEEKKLPPNFHGDIIDDGKRNPDFSHLHRRMSDEPHVEKRGHAEKPADDDEGGSGGFCVDPRSPSCYQGRKPCTNPANPACQKEDPCKGPNKKPECHRGHPPA